MRPTILSVASLQQWTMKWLGEPQWHRQRNKSKLASELARLRPRINRWLKSRNGGNYKGTDFRIPIKIRGKNKHDFGENQTSVKRKTNKLHQSDSAFQSHNDRSWKPKDLWIKTVGIGRRKCNHWEIWQYLLRNGRKCRDTRSDGILIQLPKNKAHWKPVTLELDLMSCSSLQQWVCS